MFSTAQWITSNSACSCSKWNITILHPSLGLMSSFVDSIKRKASCWLCHREQHPSILAGACRWKHDLQGKPGVFLLMYLSSDPRTDSRTSYTPFIVIKDEKYAIFSSLIACDLIQTSLNLIEKNSLSISPCCILGSWKPSTSRKLLQQLPWWHR